MKSEEMVGSFNGKDQENNKKKMVMENDTTRRGAKSGALEQGVATSQQESAARECRERIPASAPSPNMTSPVFLSNPSSFTTPIRFSL